MIIKADRVNLEQVADYVAKNRPPENDLWLTLHEEINGVEKEIHFLIRWDYVREHFSAQLMNSQNNKLDNAFVDESVIKVFNSFFTDETGITDITGFITKKDKQRQDELFII